MSSKEETLVNELKRGDSAARSELYDRYGSSLLPIAMRYMGSRDAAEDILHDAFIKIFGGVKKFNYRGEGSLRAWMSRIVVNCSLEALRKNKTLREVPLDDGTLSDMAEEESPTGVGRIPHEVLLELIGELPDGYRTIFNLYCVEEYSHREIAKMLGINEKSSSSQLLRARRMLMTKIKSYNELHK